MAGIGDFEMPRVDPRAQRAAVRIAMFVAIPLILLALLMSALRPYVSYLWFDVDAGHPEVFSTEYAAKSIIFLPAFVVSTLVIFLTLKRALRLSLIYLDAPRSPAELIVSNTLHFVQDRGKTVIKLVSPILGLMLASGVSAEWMTMLLARNGGSFGRKDPLFGLDLGFFVFTLPWYRALANYAFGVLLLATIITVAAYAGLQALAAMGRIQLDRPGTRSHLAILVGLTALAFAVQLYLKTYDYGTMKGPQFTGAGYAGVIQLQAQRIVSYLLVIAGIACFALMRSPFLFRWLARMGVAVLAVGIVGVIATPAIIQRLRVEPDKLTVEGPFAKRAIEMTRFAYDLEKIRTSDFAVKATPTPEEIQASRPTLDNMRLWDPEVVRQSIEVLQGLKPYYTFRDVDVDRYQINGRQTMVMLAPRDIRQEGLSESARTWINERLQYTHGFGLAMSSVISAGSDGEPTFLVRDIPPVAVEKSLEVSEPRIYYSDYRDDSGVRKDEYVLVNSRQPEFDYPSQGGEETTTWKGNRGIPIGGFFRRLALSIALSDGNLLVSGNVTPDTRLLLNRGVMKRAEMLYPFLNFDHDPYIVLVGGKLFWILDGYTTTDRIPYSELAAGWNGFNYIRNPVKVIVDAYTGETTAFAIDPEEPLLKAYRGVYPRLIKDQSQIPSGFREHFRYPEDMFKVQAGMLTQYHVQDSSTFLNNNDAWELPRQIGSQSTQDTLQPYYVQMRLPNEKTDGFLLMLPFTPRGKPNMSGWLAAHCDPARYGSMVLYNFARGANVAGPEQMETTINSDPKVNAARLQLQGGGQTDVVIGNLLVIPIGSSVMYAESLFPKSRSTGLQAMPRLKKVVLALNGRVEIGDTYAEALDRLLSTGTTSGQPSQPQGTKQPETGQAPAAEARKALQLLDQADSALRQGDFAKYGELQRAAREELKRLAGASAAK